MTALRPSKKTFEQVAIRDDGNCAFCGLGVSGERGFDFSLHHGVGLLAEFAQKIFFVAGTR